MKSRSVWVFLVIVLIAVNGLIIQKETVLSKGQTVLLKLVPVDPRSIMQGDYMVLSYEIAEKVNEADLQSSGHLVVALNGDSVAGFVRLHEGEELQKGEQKLFYRKRHGLRLGAESFFFQEGLGSQYQNAEYGELKVTGSGKSVLVGLRDKNFRKLGDSQHINL